MPDTAAFTSSACSCEPNGAIRSADLIDFISRQICSSIVPPIFPSAFIPAQAQRSWGRGRQGEERDDQKNALALTMCTFATGISSAGTGANALIRDLVNRPQLKRKGANETSTIYVGEGVGLTGRSAPANAIRSLNLSYLDREV
jgi:hypothetical protein